MSVVLIAATPLAGHVNPMLTVAGHLTANGHRVLFLTSENFRTAVEETGASFRGLSGKANYDYRKLDEVLPELHSIRDPMEQMNFYVKHLFAERIPDQHRDISEALASETIDAVLYEIAFLGVLPLLLGDQPRPPTYGCGVTAPVFHDPAFSMFSGPDETPDGLDRNRRENEYYDELRQPGFLWVDKVLDGLGVRIDGGYNSNALYRLPDLFLQFGSEAFEFPLHERPSGLRFIGPIVPTRRRGRSDSGFPETSNSARPLVVVTQGTLANADFDELINPAVQALEIRDVDVLVTTGRKPTENVLQAENVTVTEFIPYEEILPQAAVLVTNGGYNGVQHALSFGVPVIVVGVTEDKGPVCDRLNWSGAGIGIKTRSIAPDQLGDAIDSILCETKYKARAKEIGAAIACEDALSYISELISGAKTDS